MKKRRVVFLTCIFFIIGVGIASFLPERLNVFHLEIFILFAFLLILVFISWPKKSFQVFLWSAFLFLGIWRLFISIPENTPDKILFYNEQEINFLGVISTEPDIRETNQKLEIESFFLKNSEKEIRGKVLITTNIYPEHSYGDILEIKCELKKPEKFNDFSYDKYLARFDIYSACWWPELKNISKSSLFEKEQTARDKLVLPTWFFKNIFALKKILHQKINSGISEPEASLANAMVLGYKRGIPNDLREKFSFAGLSHIAAISGMHISIIILIIFNFSLFVGLKRQHSFYLCCLFLIFYISLIGFPASAFRASLMGFLVLLAVHVGRISRLDHTLVLTATILLLINPKQLMSDIGFQLSFLAVLGIAYLYPIFKKKISIFFKNNGNRFLEAILNILAVTVSAQIFTLPIVFYNFKTISLISPLANLLVLWSLPFVLISVFAGLILSFLFPALSVLFFSPASLLLKYIIFVSEFLVKIPFSFFFFK